jgi:hypothetical protein
MRSISVHGLEKLRIGTRDRQVKAAKKLADL